MDPCQSIRLPPGVRRMACVEMHTYGMPTRLVISGYPDLRGTLLEQKAEAERDHDKIRRSVLHEPRGHADMFGAILRCETEFTKTGEAHMGVLYIHGHGYSNMCGHATIALCRFLIDTCDLSIFPRRNDINYDAKTQTASLIIHTPGGLVSATVPTTDYGNRSDPTRPIKFIALPAYAIATEIEVFIPPENRWPELGSRETVNISLAYCGTFISQVLLEELGISSRIFEESTVDFSRFRYATSQVKNILNTNPELRKYLKYPNQEGYGTVFGVMVTDKSNGIARADTKGAELGIYFFGGSHIDRSPTGSAAAARAALDIYRGNLQPGDSWTYHSVPSYVFGLEGLVATVFETRHVASHGPGSPVKVQIEGNAYYTGFSTLLHEADDSLGETGFLWDEMFVK